MNQNKTELTQDEIQGTIDAIERFKPSDPGLKKTYEIEFVITNTESSIENSIKLFLTHTKINFKKIEIRGSDVLVIIEMKLERDNILEIESSLTYFANENGLKYDGWGAFE